MRPLLLFLFLAYPMLEIALMIKVGGAIGVWSTLGIIMATGIAGALTLRRHGLIFLRRMSQALADGQPPVETALHGALVGTAGLMLIAPGLITDVVGLLLLLTPIRRLIILLISRHFDVTGESSDRRGGGKPPVGAQRPGRQPLIIEGDYQRLDERPDSPKTSHDSAAKRQPDTSG